MKGGNYEAELAGGKVVSVPLRREDLQYDVDAMLKAITPRTKVKHNNRWMEIFAKELVQFA